LTLKTCTGCVETKPVAEFVPIQGTLRFYDTAGHVEIVARELLVDAQDQERGDRARPGQQTETSGRGAYPLSVSLEISRSSTPTRPRSRLCSRIARHHKPSQSRVRGPTSRLRLAQPAR
jgi:hypothetical protein